MDPRDPRRPLFPFLGIGESPMNFNDALDMVDEAADLHLQSADNDMDTSLARHSPPLSDTFFDSSPQSSGLSGSGDHQYHQHQQLQLSSPPSMFVPGGFPYDTDPYASYNNHTDPLPYQYHQHVSPFAPQLQLSPIPPSRATGRAFTTSADDNASSRQLVQYTQSQTGGRARARSPAPVQQPKMAVVRKPIVPDYGSGSGSDSNSESNSNSPEAAPLPEPEPEYECTNQELVIIQLTKDLADGVVENARKDKIIKKLLTINKKKNEQSKLDRNKFAVDPVDEQGRTDVKVPVYPAKWLREQEKCREHLEQTMKEKDERVRIVVYRKKHLDALAKGPPDVSDAWVQVDMDEMNQIAHGVANVFKQKDVVDVGCNTVTDDLMVVKKEVDDVPMDYSPDRNTFAIPQRMPIRNNNNQKGAFDMDSDNDGSIVSMDNQLDIPTPRGRARTRQQASGVSASLNGSFSDDTKSVSGVRRSGRQRKQMGNQSSPSSSVDGRRRGQSVPASPIVVSFNNDKKKKADTKRPIPRSTSRGRRGRAVTSPPTSPPRSSGTRGAARTRARASSTVSTRRGRSAVSMSPPPRLSPMKIQKPKSEKKRPAQRARQSATPSGRGQNAKKARMGTSKSPAPPTSSAVDDEPPAPPSEMDVLLAGCATEYERFMMEQLLGGCGVTRGRRHSVAPPREPTTPRKKGG